MADYKFSNDKTFINPYNFVPNGVTKRLAVKAAPDDVHTGVLHCRLTTKTELIIPDAENKTGTEHYRYPFMNVNGKPVIPASSLRGPIRSIFEAATNSCYSTVKDDQTVTNRTKKPFDPGLLRKENGVWKLYAAQRDKLDKRAEEIIGIREGENQKFKYGDPVRKVDIGRGGVVTSISAAGTGEPDGYLFIGEDFPLKRSESIFCVSENKSALPIDENQLKKAVNHLKSVLTYYHDMYNNPDTRTKLGKHSGYKHIDAGLFQQEGKYIPVWYERKRGVIHLSFANIGRYAYEKTLNDVLDTYDACRSLEKRCEACDLFGMAREGEAACGKVRFTDARLVQYKEMDDVVLKELGTPHITYLPFYMQGLLDFDVNGARIRGRKFYWHHETEKIEGRLVNAKKSNLNATMQYMDKGTFTFDVYYDRISAKQLKQLMWVLCLGENDPDSAMCHKIGHAKPLGFGSVKIVIEGREERTFSDQDGYCVTEIPVKEEDFSDAFTGEKYECSLEALKVITDFNAVNGKAEVRYPYVEPVSELDPNKPLNDNVLASHQWYTRNFALGAKTAIYSLADITAGVTELEMGCLEAENFAGKDYKKNNGSKQSGKGKQGKQRSKSDRTAKTSTADMVMHTGKIKTIFINKGFGFIMSDKGGDMFFHANECNGEFDSLKVEDRVSYKIGIGRNGKSCAVDVKKID